MINDVLSRFCLSPTSPRSLEFCVTEKAFDSAHLLFFNLVISLVKVCSLFCKSMIISIQRLSSLRIGATVQVTSRVLWFLQTFCTHGRQIRKLIFCCGAYI